MLATSARCLLASSRSGAAAVTTTAVRGKATLPDLPYDYNALEPVIMMTSKVIIPLLR